MFKCVKFSQLRQILQQCGTEVNSFKLTSRSFNISSHTKATKSSDKQSSSGSDQPSSPSPLDELDKPIQYSTSRASKWTAFETHMGALHKEVPWYQTWVIVGSVTCLLVWFTILREENDLDEQIGKTLWERVPGLEKQQLLMLKKYNLQQSRSGLSIMEIDQRLEEIERMEKEAKALAQVASK